MPGIFVCVKIIW